LTGYGTTADHTTRRGGATSLAEKSKGRWTGDALNHAGRWRSNIVDEYIHRAAEWPRLLIAKL
jgi:hypothetical protein